MIASLIYTLLSACLSHQWALAVQRAARAVRRLILPRLPHWRAPGSLPEDIALYCACYATGCPTLALACARTYWQARG